MKRTARPRLSVIIIARNEGQELRRTVENLQPRLPASSELIVVDDGSEDESTGFLHRGVRLLRAQGLGVAAARNFGARKSHGEVILFADAHIRVPEDWWQPLDRVLSGQHVGAAAPAVRNLRQGHRGSAGYGLTFTGHDLEVKWLPRASGASTPVPILPGCCLAMTRDTFETTGGWDGALLQRGGVDNELSIRLWLLGYELRIVPEVEVRHLFRKRSPFPVGWTQFLHNRLRLALVHFSPIRVGRVLAALAGRDEIGAALLLAIERGAYERRREIFLRRKRNDDWYFERFGLE